MSNPTQQAQPFFEVCDVISSRLPDVTPSDIAHAINAAATIERRIIGRHCGDACDKILQYLCVAQYARSTGRTTVNSLEIGTLFGGSCLMKLSAMRDLQLSGKVVCIDPMSGFYSEAVDPLTGMPVNEETFFANIARFGFDPRMVDLRKYTSDKEAAQDGLEEGTFATVMIDGDHSYQGVKGDWQRFHNYADDSGIIIIDDYDDPAWPDIKAFCDELQSTCSESWRVLAELSTTLLLCRSGAYGEPGNRTNQQLSAPKADDSFVETAYAEIKTIQLNSLTGTIQEDLSRNDLPSAGIHLEALLVFQHPDNSIKMKKVLETGDLLMRNGAVDKALAFFDIAMNYAGTSNETLFNLTVRIANIHWSKREYDQADRYFRLGLLIPDVPQQRLFYPLLGIGKCLAAKQRYDEAGNFFQRAVSLEGIEDEKRAAGIQELVACQDKRAAGGFNTNGCNAPTISSASNVLEATHATVREYNRFLEQYPTLTFTSGDLKNFQRPWVIDRVLKYIKPGARILEIGADKCELADYLQQAGYEVWVIDVFDELGGGVAKFENMTARFSNIHFTKGFLHLDETLPSGYFDAIYSCSVIEHNPRPDIKATFEKIDTLLKPGGYSIHAVDYTVDGPVHLNLTSIQEMMSVVGGISAEDAARSALEDVETFYLSPAGHYQWRKFLNKTYEEYPFRKTTSFSLVTQKQ